MFAQQKIDIGEATQDFPKYGLHIYGEGYVKTLLEGFHLRGTMWLSPHMNLISLGESLVGLTIKLPVLYLPWQGSVIVEVRNM